MRIIIIMLAAQAATAADIMLDYEEANIEADRSRSMLLVSCEPTPNSAVEDHLSKSERLKSWTVCRVTGEAAKKLASCQHVSEMHGSGIFVVDHMHPEFDGRVVSILPFRNGKYYRFSPEYIDVLVELPPATLTQRSMIFAVRIHPDRPRSTESKCDPMLLMEADSHSRHQARICLQGHHNWEARYHRIVAAAGGSASEVCAESWENQDLIDSCIDCTLSWRQSPGHWKGVSSPNSAYGYDIARGRNGIWYGTGIFLNR